MLQHATEKEPNVKHGHVTGHKQERQGSAKWYKKYYEEHIRRIEAEWQARDQQRQQ